MGISADPLESNRAWAESLKLPFRLLSDVAPKGAVGRLYGVWDDTWGLEKRATFIIDRQGVIRHLLTSTLALDDQPVLDALRQLVQKSSGR